MKTLALLLLLLQQRGAISPEVQIPASVDGVVVDSQTGRPLAGATVLFQTNGGPAGTMIRVTGTDGTFAFRNVTPGGYIIEASRGGYVPEKYGVPLSSAPPIIAQLTPGQKLSGLRLVMTPGGAITGRLTDDRGEAVVGAVVQALKTTYSNGRPQKTLVQTVVSNDLGEYRFFMLKPGQYTITVEPPSVAYRLNQASTIPLYYPGTIDVNAAQPIDLQTAQTIDGVNFVSIPTRNRRVEGTVQASGSDPIGVLLSPLNGTSSSQVAIDVSNGQFQFNNVIPGAYMLVARSSEMRSVIPLDVRNADFLGTRIALGPGYKIPVRVRIEGNPVSGDPEVENLYFDVRPELPVPGLEPETYSPVANGRFTLEVLRRAYRIDIARTQDYYIKSMTLEGVDVLNQGLSVTSSMEGPLEMLVAKTFGSVEGRTDRPDVTVVLVPDAARRGQQALFKSVKPNSGTFRFEKGPPGDYKLFALTEENGGPYLDPEYIQKYENRGTPVRVQGNMITRVDTALPAL
jgi:hypothetical protein